MNAQKRSRGRSIVELLQKHSYTTIPVTTSTIDQLLNEAGSFGLYQIGQFILVGLLAVLPAMAAFNYVFIAGTPEHRCRLSSNDTFEIQSFEHNLTIMQMIPKEFKYKNCYIYNSSTNRKPIKCSEWVYSQQIYNTTISTDWNLVCDRLHLKGITQNAYIIGTSGSLLSGIMSDKFGRRTTMYSLILLMAFVLNTSQFLMYSKTLSNNMKLIIFTISRLLTGFAQTTYSITLVLLMEMTSANRRVLASNILSYFFALGEIIIMGTYYYTQDWLMTMWIFIVYILPFLSYYWCVPESARWLVSTGRLPQARKVIHRIASINRRKITNAEKKLYADLQRDARIRPKRYSYTHVLIGLVKSPIMRRRCLILFYIWMVNLMVYLGIGMGITALSPLQPYRIFLVAAFAELIGLCMCHFCATKFGRKIPLILFLFLCSLSILVIPLTHTRFPYISMLSAISAKLFISASQALSWTYTSETYPTVIRSTGVGLTVSIARIGGVWAPQISLLSQSVWFPLPYLIFSTCSLIAAILALFLPETRAKQALPDTVKQAEKFDEQQSPVTNERVLLSTCSEDEETTHLEAMQHSDQEDSEAMSATTIPMEDQQQMQTQTMTSVAMDELPPQEATIETEEKKY